MICMAWESTSTTAIVRMCLLFNLDGRHRKSSYQEVLLSQHKLFSHILVTRSAARSTLCSTQRYWLSRSVLCTPRITKFINSENLKKKQLVHRINNIIRNDMNGGRYVGVDKCRRDVIANPFLFGANIHGGCEKAQVKQTGASAAIVSMICPSISKCFA